MTTLNDKKQLIRQFLQRCNEYADTKLNGYQKALSQSEGPDALTVTDKIAHWTAYRTFNEYTIDELGTDALDDWFAES